MQQLGYLAERGVLASRHEISLRRHDVRDRHIHAGLETNVAAGDDADEIVAAHHGNAGDAVLAGEFHQVAHGGLRVDHDGVADDAAFELFDGPDFARLGLQRHVLVDDADAAFLR